MANTELLPSGWLNDPANRPSQIRRKAAQGIRTPDLARATTVIKQKSRPTSGLSRAETKTLPGQQSQKIARRRQRSRSVSKRVRALARRQSEIDSGVTSDDTGESRRASKQQSHGDKYIHAVAAARTQHRIMQQRGAAHRTVKSGEMRPTTRKIAADERAERSKELDDFHAAHGEEGDKKLHPVERLVKALPHYKKSLQPTSSGEHPKVYLTRPKDRQHHLNPNKYSFTTSKPDEHDPHEVYQTASVRIGRSPLLVEMMTPVENRRLKSAVATGNIRRAQALTKAIRKRENTEYPRKRKFTPDPTLVDLRKSQQDKQDREKAASGIAAEMRRKAIERRAALAKRGLTPFSGAQKRSQDRPALTVASIENLDRTPLIAEVVVAVAVAPSPHVRPDLIDRTIVGGKSVRGATTTANSGLRSKPSGFAVNAHKAIPPGRYKKKKKKHKK